MVIEASLVRLKARRLVSVPGFWRQIVFVFVGHVIVRGCDGLRAREEKDSAPNK